jgi:Periplasmic copper-binding protein (NosD)
MDGLDVGLQNNRIEGSDMGIVVRDAARRVAVTGNQLTGQERQGISLRDGVREATVTGNVITGADTAIYLRDSVAEVRGNTVQKARNHGITLVGDAGGTVISYNVVSGVGPSAVDTPRSRGKLTVRENQTFAWYDTSSFWIKFRHYFSPMTMLWTGILLLILFSAARGAFKGTVRARHPYADKMPLPVPAVSEISAQPAPVDRPAARGRAQVPLAAR